MTFEYLGVLINSKGTSDQAIKLRIDKARKAFWALDSSVWRVAQLKLFYENARLQSLRVVGPSLWFRGWTPTWLTVKVLEKFHMICRRKNFGPGPPFSTPALRVE